MKLFTPKIYQRPAFANILEFKHLRHFTAQKRGTHAFPFPSIIKYYYYFNISFAMPSKRSISFCKAAFSLVKASMLAACSPTSCCNS